MRCNRCKVIKNESEFSPGKHKCKLCQKKCLAYYKKHRQSEIARARKSQEKIGQATINAKKIAFRHKNPISYLLDSAKARAKKHNVPFELVREDVYVPQYCPILGIELRVNSKHSGPDSPSLDRIIPSLGYVRGNIQIISHRANTIKNDATLDELKKVVAYLEKNPSLMLPS